MDRAAAARVMYYKVHDLWAACGPVDCVFHSKIRLIGVCTISTFISTRSKAQLSQVKYLPKFLLMMHRGKEPILSPVLFPHVSGSADKYFKECTVLMKDLHVLFPCLKFPSNCLLNAVLLLFSGFGWHFTCSSTVLQCTKREATQRRLFPQKPERHILLELCQVRVQLHSYPLTISNFLFIQLQIPI